MTVQELSRYLTLRKQIDEDKEIYENMCQHPRHCQECPILPVFVIRLVIWPQTWQTWMPASKSLKPKPKGYFQQ